MKQKEIINLVKKFGTADSSNRKFIVNKIIEEIIEVRK